MPDFRFSLRFLLYPDGKWWIAHCLEMDIVAEGKTATDALANALRLCAAQIKFAKEAGDFASIFRPAPAHFWTSYAQGRDFRNGKKPPAPISTAEVRELAPA